MPSEDRLPRPGGWVSNPSARVPDEGLSRGESFATSITEPAFTEGLHWTLEDRLNLDVTIDESRNACR